MLVLSRLKEQELVIGKGEDQIRVKILRIKPNGSVSIGVSAPRDVKVLRGELGIYEETKGKTK